MRHGRFTRVVFGFLDAAIVASCWPHATRAAIIVRLDPPSATVSLGDGFDIQLKADIGEPVIGWGADLEFDHAILSMIAPPDVGPAWSPAYAPDGDELVGLAFPADVSGNDIVLVTLHFKAIAIGESDLVPGVTSGDLAEGFAVFPTGFAQATFQRAHVKVLLPEPGSVVLLACATLLNCARRRGTR